jgi:cytochrome c oxidase subunit IV
MSWVDVINRAGVGKLIQPFSGLRQMSLMAMMMMMRVSPLIAVLCHMVREDAFLSYTLFASEVEWLTRAVFCKYVVI